MSFLTTVVETWHGRMPPWLGSVVRRADDDSKLIIEIQSAHHLATIEAWEMAPCLDVTILEISSGTGAILSAGECPTANELQARITQLLQKLEK
jgi:hypothetical protein